MAGGREQMLARLNDPALRARMEKDILNGVPGWFDHYLAMKGWESCVVAAVNSDKNKMHEGKSIEQISKALNKKYTAGTNRPPALSKSNTGTVVFLFMLWRFAQWICPRASVLSLFTAATTQLSSPSWPDSDRTTPARR